MTAQVATAGSEHPVPGQAVAECVGALLDAHMESPDLLWVFAGVPFSGALLELSGALSSLLSAASTVAVVSEGVVLGGRVSRAGPALGVLALRGPFLRSFWLPPGEPLDGADPVRDASDGSDTAESVAMVAADPFSIRAADLAVDPGDRLRVVGGNLAAGSSMGANRIAVDGVEHRAGAAVTVLAPDSARGLIAHGTAAVAPPMVATSVDGTTVVALDELPAAEAFELAMSSADSGILTGATEVGLRRVGRNELVGVRRSPGGLETIESIAVGEMVEPAVRSAAVAGSELAGLLGDGACAGRSGAAAVCFLDLARPGAAVSAGDAAVLADRFGSQDVGMLVGGVHSGVLPPRSVLRGVAGLVVFGN